MFESIGCIVAALLSVDDEGMCIGFEAMCTGLGGMCIGFEEMCI